MVCINAYPSQGGLAREGLGFDLSTSGEMWSNGIAALHELYPEKPILVTEFGHPSLETTFGHAFGEDTAASVIEHEFAGMQHDYRCGAIVWCWADHAWPAETFRMMNGLATSPFGVVSRERRKKAAYWTTRRLFIERQGRL